MNVIAVLFILLAIRSLIKLSTWEENPNHGLDAHGPGICGLFVLMIWLSGAFISLAVFMQE